MKKNKFTPVGDYQKWFEEVLKLENQSESGRLKRETEQYSQRWIDYWKIGLKPKDALAQDKADKF